MKQALLHGLPPERRLKGTRGLGAIVLALLLAKSLGALPEFLDELPLHLEKSSIDTLGDAGKEAYTELVPFGLMLDHSFEYMRNELGFRGHPVHLQTSQGAHRHLRQRPARREQGIRSGRTSPGPH